MDRIIRAKEKGLIMKYSVVIPCYRSSHTIADVVSETIKEFKALGLDDHEFILVDDFSPDGGDR